MGLLAALTGSEWVLIIGAVFVGLTSLVTSVVQIVIGWLREAAKIKREEVIADELRKAAQQVKEVKTTLEDSTSKTDGKLNGIADNTMKSLKWNNHLMAMQLKTVAELSREKSERTKSPGDVRAAEQAEQLYAEHLEQQAKMDGQQQAQIDRQTKILGEIAESASAIDANTKRDV